MGSSKKRKEKREKKKHKRSRSGSHERSKRSHKHTREKKHSRDSHSKDRSHKRKRHADSSEEEYNDGKRAVDVRNEASVGSTAKSQVIQVSSPDPGRRIVEHYSSGGEDDDFDPESLLEEKLLENEEYSSRSNKPPKKNLPNILETLMGKDAPNLEMFRKVIMQREGLPNFPGGFQISITNRDAESIAPVVKVEDSQDRFEYLPPQKKIKLKEPVYETARYERRQYEVNEWEDAEPEFVGGGPSHQPSSVVEKVKLQSELGQKPFQVMKTIPGLELDTNSAGCSQSSRSGVETNWNRKRSSVKSLPISSGISDAEHDSLFQGQEGLNISESNKLRASLGLKPLQVSTPIPGLEPEPDGPFQGQESLSISETNKLRASLGLKPLQVSQPVSGIEAEPNIPKQSQQQALSISQTNKLRAKMGKKPLQVSKSVVPEIVPEPEEDGQCQESLSISKTNELRAKLGLKPLQVSESIPGLGATEEEKEAASSTTATKEIFVKTENLTEKRETEKLRERIKVQKEKRKIVEKLSKVKGLGESDSEDESAASWVKKSRKIQEEKEKAEKRAKLLEEMDAEFGIGALVEEEFEKKKKDKAYTAKNLKGLTVSHTVGSFKEGHEIILTLKDKDVLDEDEDVLENVNLIDEERYARNVENRKKKPMYVAYEEPEFDEFGILQKKNILSKYDEEEESTTQKKAFKLGEENYQDKEKELELIRMKLKQKQGISLEMPNMKVASEYYTQEEETVKFKKPKKKVRKVRKRPLKADDLVPDGEGSNDYGRRNYTETELDDAYIYGEIPRVQPETKIEPQEVSAAAEEPDVIGPSEDLTGVVVDEDQAEKELNAALSKARRLKQRKTVVPAPEKIVEMLKKTTEDMDTTPESKSAPIVLNSTAEFCRTLGEIPTYGMSGNRDEEADELLDFERELIEERKKQEMEAQNRGAWNEVDIDEKPAEILIKENEPILEEEPDIRVGVAGALALAQKKGYLDKDTKKTAAAHRVSQLQAQSYTIEEKFYDDDKFGKRDRYTGPIQDFREKYGYKPDIKLEYIDDSGRLLTAKEAFRYLSHKFHGKGPGKNKVDKRMKKLEQETRLKQMSSTDTPLNTVKLLQAKQKEMQSPYIVLSGGSKTLTQTMISKTKPT